jgi:hypothetical protein
LGERVNRVPVSRAIARQLAEERVGIDWIAALRQQGDLTKKVSKDIRIAIDHPNLTLDQAVRIHGMVELGARTFAQFVHSANAQNLPGLYYEAAGILENIWSTLAEDAMNKILILRERGLTGGAE